MENKEENILERLKDMLNDITKISSNYTIPDGMVLLLEDLIKELDDNYLEMVELMSEVDFLRERF